MRLTVAGEDRSADWAAECQAIGRNLIRHPDAPPVLETFHSALILRQAKDEADYLTKLVDLMVLKAGIGAEDFYIPRRPGLRGVIGAWVKRFLWRLLRYQHERIVAQQNAVNTQLAVAIQFLMQEYRQRLASLEARLDAVEGGRNRSNEGAPH